MTQLTFYVRAAGDAGGTAAAARDRRVQRLDPNLPIFDMKTMTAQVSESLFIERMVAALSVAFGGARDAARGDRPLRRDVVRGGAPRRARSASGWRSAPSADRVLWLVLREVASWPASGL